MNNLSDERITELESVVTHLQKLVFDLNESVVAQQKRIDLMQRDMVRLIAEVKVARDAIQETRRPEDEIPPHY